MAADDVRTDQAETGDEDSVLDRLSRRRQRLRDKIGSNAALDLTYRIVIGVVGLAVLVLGIIAIPYPGPGWLIVFAGLGILASEFTWAHRLLQVVRGKYDRFMEWFSRQPIAFRALGVLLTAGIVLATLWLIGGLYLVTGWIGPDWHWLASPL
ncbi:TIGR02611 family protein [Rhodococcus sp. PAMC28707]|uniref:TIGR02611 family protein n=1 Tax=unclassified Rhodococcus (in: high G+C Gram-positive bacteria) TaxID=192944 RepID=UPI00109E0B89|nr:MULTISPECIES: TIGR02611 family protein [unclassified Rhodococcus (in: high G+C Gram-positive bacteria)]QCB51016.1 TIGR02611 family protein [Rhodococcus sp. PAMC28705]QCB57292.1 TIGR02611 family protein [Rhodococcus sp. PAMC28707]